MNLTKILENADRFDSIIGVEGMKMVKLALDLEKSYHELREKFEEANDVWSLYVAVRDGIGDETIAKAFYEIGAEETYAGLKDLANDFDGKLPNEMEILLRNLGHYNEAATGSDVARQRWITGDDLGLIAWDKSGKLLSGSQKAYTIDSSVSAAGRIGVSLEAGSLWFYGNDEISSKGLFRIGLSGELGLNARGSVPFGSIGGVTVANVNSVGAQAHLFWRRPEDNIVAQVIADIVSRPINIFSLEDMLKACHGPAGLEGIIIAIDGHTTLDIDLAVARDIDVEGFFSATAGLTVSVGLARKAAYELSVRKVPDGVRLVLSHADEDARKWGVGIGIDIDATQVARRVGDVLHDAVEHWDEVLTGIKPFLSPGTWLQNRAGVQLIKLLGALEDQISDDTVVNALRQDLQLALGLKGDGDHGLARLLSERVLDAISSIEGAVVEDAKSFSRKVVAKIAVRLPSVAQAALQTRLETEVEDLIKRYQDVLTTVTEDLAKNQADKVAKALGNLGKKVSAIASAQNARADVLRGLVEEADTLVHKIAKAVQEAALAKISARLRFERGRLDNEQYEVIGTFTDSTAEASTFYKSLMMGRLDGVRAIYDPSLSAIPGFSPERDMCSVRRFSKVSKSLGYEIVLLGMNLTGNGETSGSADVEVDANGGATVRTVSIAKRGAQGLLKTSRKTDFVQTGSMILSKAESTERPKELQTSFVINISSQRQDKNLSVYEVKSFLALMTRHSLISETRSNAVAAYLAQTIGNRGGGKLSGAITVEMMLSGADVAKLTTIGRGIIGHVDECRSAEARKIFDTALDSLFETDEWDRDEFEWFVGKYIKAINSYDRGGTDPFREKYFANLENVVTGLVRPGPRSQNNPEQTRFANCRSRHEAVVALMSLVAKTAEMDTATPSRSRNGDGAKWGLREYRQASFAVADAADEWIGLNQWGFFFFGKGMDQRTVAFMLSLARLTQRPVIGNTIGHSYDALFDISLVLGDGDAQGF